MSDNNLDNIQVELENKYSRKFFSEKLKLIMTCDEDFMQKVGIAATLLEIAVREKEYLPKKAARMASIADMDFTDLAEKIAIASLYCQIPELYVNFTAQLANTLGFSDHRDSIQTIAELVAVVAEADLYTITNTYRDNGRMYIKSDIKLHESIIDEARELIAIPPMVTPPNPIDTNFESPYLTFNESQFTGSKSEHAGDICLEIINRQNAVSLQFNDLLMQYTEETPTFEFETKDQEVEWENHIFQCNNLYEKLNDVLTKNQSHRLYVTYKPDARGRLYSVGHHVNPQGTPYKKAMLQLGEEEIVITY